MMRALAVVLVAGCGGSPLVPILDEPRALGMSDVSILVPLPAELSTPVIARISPGMIPIPLATGLAIASDIGPKGNTMTVRYEDFQVVSIRFDPCARDHIGTCTSDEAGRLRLVLQPLYLYEGAPAGHDIALHAFYPIPNAELPAVVAELRALAAIQDAPLDAPLAVSPALAADPAGAYATRLRALIATYAREDNLVQLTTIGQDKFSAAFAWLFGGYVKHADGTWQLIPIPAAGTTRQHVLVSGGNIIFEANPHVDAPYRLGTAMNGGLFELASAEEKRLSLEALAEIENPARHDANDMQCIACHISTVLMARRSEQLAMDPADLARAYTTAYNVAVDTIANRDPRVVRAFGFVAAQPAISRRVANDTAYVLEELDRRFPVTSTTAE